MKHEIPACQAPGYQEFHAVMETTSKTEHSPSGQDLHHHDRDKHTWNLKFLVTALGLSGISCCHGNHAETIPDLTTTLCSQHQVYLQSDAEQVFVNGVYKYVAEVHFYIVWAVLFPAYILLISFVVSYNRNYSLFRE